jgi:hypothetical protein
MVCVQEAKVAQPHETTAALATIRIVRTTPSQTLTKMQFGNHINCPKRVRGQLLV